MFTKLKTIPQIIAEITAEEPEILPVVDKLYDHLKDGSIKVYQYDDVPLLNEDEVAEVFEL